MFSLRILRILRMSWVDGFSNRKRVVGELKKRLAKVRDQPQMTVNADALLNQLEGVVGTDHETRDALTETEAEVALEELRRKMQAEDGAPGEDGAE